VLSDAVEGLRANLDLHDTYVMLEKHIGIPMDLHKRIQFNVEIFGSQEIDSLKRANPVIFPLFWIDENATIDDKNYNDYKQDVVKPIRWVKAISIGFGMVLGGILLIAGTTVCWFS